MTFASGRWAFYIESNVFNAIGQEQRTWKPQLFGLSPQKAFSKIKTNKIKETAAMYITKIPKAANIWYKNWKLFF